MIRRADKEDAGTLAALAIQMWDSHELQDLAEDFEKTMEGKAACFIGYDGNDPVAFAQCGLRYDYVEGPNSSPVGYLEGMRLINC